MEIIKREDKEPKCTKYSFPTTPSMKEQLDKLRDIEGWDINEMLRVFSTQLIEKAKEQNKAG